MSTVTSDFTIQALISTGQFTQSQADYLASFQLLVGVEYSISHSSNGYYVFAMFNSERECLDAYEVLIKENFKVEFTVFEDSLRIFPK